MDSSINSTESKPSKLTDTEVVEPAVTVAPTAMSERSFNKEVLDEYANNEAKLDYSGAAKKTDPREIRLVKKLDWYIMVFILPDHL